MASSLLCGLAMLGAGSLAIRPDITKTLNTDDSLNRTLLSAAIGDSMLAEVAVTFRPPKDPTTEQTDVDVDFIALRSDSVRRTTVGIDLDTPIVHVDSLFLVVPQGDSAPDLRLIGNHPHVRLRALAAAAPLDTMATVIRGRANEEAKRRAESRGMPQHAGIDSIRLPESMFVAMRSGQDVRLRLRLTGVRDYQSWVVQNAVHEFPLDIVCLKLPVSFNERALVSSVSVHVPSGWVPTAQVNGVPTALYHTGENMSSVPANEDGPATQRQFRRPLGTGQRMTLEITLRRPVFQRFVLLAFPLIVAVLVGVLIAILASFPQRAVILTILPYAAVFGLFLVFYRGVFAQYSELPHLSSGTGITLFELIYLLAFGVMVASVILARRAIDRGQFVSPLLWNRLRNLLAPVPQDQ